MKWISPLFFISLASEGFFFSFFFRSSRSGMTTYLDSRLSTLAKLSGWKSAIYSAFTWGTEIAHSFKEGRKRKPTSTNHTRITMLRQNQPWELGRWVYMHIHMHVCICIINGTTYRSKSYTVHVLPYILRRMKCDDVAPASMWIFFSNMACLLSYSASLLWQPRWWKLASVAILHTHDLYIYKIILTLVAVI